MEASRPPLVLAIAMASLLGWSIGMSPAAGDPAARSAAANRLVASVANITLPEDVGRRIEAKISGQILSSGKFGPRKCRLGRPPRTENTSIGGRTIVRDFHPTNKAGRFSGTFPLEYGGTDPEDGMFRDGDVPYAGGTVTLSLIFPRTKVQKKPGDIFRTYVCRPFSLPLQITVPPQASVPP